MQDISANSDERRVLRYQVFVIFFGVILAACAEKAFHSADPDEALRAEASTAQRELKDLLEKIDEMNTTTSGGLSPKVVSNPGK